MPALILEVLLWQVVLCQLVTSRDSTARYPIPPPPPSTGGPPPSGLSDCYPGTLKAVAPGSHGLALPVHNLFGTEHRVIHDMELPVYFLPYWATLATTWSHWGLLLQAVPIHGWMCIPSMHGFTSAVNGS